MYAWGKIGENSLVGRLKANTDADFALDGDKPYAEYWMGTHQNNSSLVAGCNVLLGEWLKKNPSVVGTVPDGYPADDIPFLFKVLSIGKTLSIQVHPDRELARELHANRPDIYKDPNHKPEMSIALTKFEAMCGLRDTDEIETFVNKFPELGVVIGYDKNTKSLKDLWKNFLTCDDAVVQEQLASFHDNIKDRLLRKEKEGSPEGTWVHSQFIPPCNLAMRLMVEFPGDRGAFCPMLLKCLHLEPGDAFFMGPNQPHAYVSGDCLEVMAPSDNVIRCACTPKYKDTETLCSTIDYNSTSIRPIIHPTQVNDSQWLYRPPPSQCCEFELNKHVISAASGLVTLPRIDCCSIVLVLEGSVDFIDERTGECSHAREGSVYLLPSNSEIKCTSVGEGSAVIYRSNRNLGTA